MAPGKNIQWTLATRAILAISVAFISYCIIDFSRDSAKRDKDAPTAEELASTYFETPVVQFRNLKGSFMVRRFIDSQPLSGPHGYIEFDSDSLPQLRDSGRYKPGGDIIHLSDNFVTMFGKDAWPLLHTGHVHCLRMLENAGNGEQTGFARWLLYNDKTNRYFFVRGPLHYQAMSPSTSNPQRIQ